MQPISTHNQERKEEEKRKKYSTALKTRGPTRAVFAVFVAKL